MHRYFTILVTILPSNHSRSNLHNSKFVATAACSANFDDGSLAWRKEEFTISVTGAARISAFCFVTKMLYHPDRSILSGSNSPVGEISSPQLILVG